MKLYSLANNQNVVVTEKDLTLFSYEKAVCQIIRSGLEIVFSHEWDYSKTTTKYVCRFLADYFDTSFNKTAIQKLLNSERYEYGGKTIPVVLRESI